MENQYFVEEDEQRQFGGPFFPQYPYYPGFHYGYHHPFHHYPYHHYPIHHYPYHHYPFPRWFGPW